MPTATTKWVNPEKSLAMAHVLDCEAALEAAERHGENTGPLAVMTRQAYKVAHEYGLTDAGILGELRDTSVSL